MTVQDRNLTSHTKMASAPAPGGGFPDLGRLNTGEQVQFMQGLVAAYVSGAAIKAGDVVRAKPFCNSFDTADLLVVMETRAPDDAFWSNDPEDEATSSAFGHRLDMRVMTISDGEVFTYWVESWQFDLVSEPQPIQG